MSCLQKPDSVSYSTKPPAMRILLLIYVIVFLLLNFFIDHPYIYYLAMSTFPVSLYLLLRKTKTKQQKTTLHTTMPESRTTKKEDRL